MMIEESSLLPTSQVPTTVLVVSIGTYSTTRYDTTECPQQTIFRKSVGKLGILRPGREPLSSQEVGFLVLGNYFFQTVFYDSLVYKSSALPPSWWGSCSQQLQRSRNLQQEEGELLSVKSSLKYLPRNKVIEWENINRYLRKQIREDSNVIQSSERT